MVPALKGIGRPRQHQGSSMSTVSIIIIFYIYIYIYIYDHHGFAEDKVILVCACVYMFITRDPHPCCCFLPVPVCAGPLECYRICLFMSICMHVGCNRMRALSAFYVSGRSGRFLLIVQCHSMQCAHQRRSHCIACIVYCMRCRFDICVCALAQLCARAHNGRTTSNSQVIPDCV